MRDRRHRPPRTLPPPSRTRRGPPMRPRRRGCPRPRATAPGSRGRPPFGCRTSGKSDLDVEAPVSHRAHSQPGRWLRRALALLPASPAAPLRGPNRRWRASRSWPAPAAVDQNHREVGRLVVGLVGEPQHFLAGHGAALDIDRPLGKTGGLQRTTHFWQIAAELHHHQRVDRLQPFAQGRFVERRRHHGQDVVAKGDRYTARGPAAGHAGNAGHHHDGHPAGDTAVQMHERAVEERVTFAQHGDVATGGDMLQQPTHAIVVKDPQHIAIGRIFQRDLGGDRIFQRLLDHAGRQHAIDHGAGVAGASGFPEMGDHAGRGDQPRRLEAHQLRIAGAEADAVDGRGRTHSVPPATALSAAAAIALPPRRPRTITLGTRALATSASLDSAAPTKPTGMPITAAGGATSGSCRISSRRNSAVGALPITTTDPASCSRHNSTAAAVRVVPSETASADTRGSDSVQITALSAGSRALVTPWATIWVSQRIGAPARNATVAASLKPELNTMSSATSTMPLAWMIRTATFSSPASKRSSRASARM